MDLSKSKIALCRIIKSWTLIILLSQFSQNLFAMPFGVNVQGGIAGGTPFQSFQEGGEQVSASGSVSEGLFTSSATANLSSGKLGLNVSAPFYQNASAQSGLTETLTFDLSAFDPDAVIPIGIGLQLDGSFQDGSNLSFAFSAVSPATVGFDALVAQVGYIGTNLGPGNFPVSGDFFDIGDSNTRFSVLTGDWLTTELDTYFGEIDIFATDPTLTLSLTLSGNGVVDFANTASLSLVLPENVSFRGPAGKSVEISH